jgi:tetratricopeptide (TPR) repeat protein
LKLAVADALQLAPIPEQLVAPDPLRQSALAPENPDVEGVADVAEPPPAVIEDEAADEEAEEPADEEAEEPADEEAEATADEEADDGPADDERERRQAEREAREAAEREAAERQAADEQAEEASQDEDAEEDADEEVARIDEDEEGAEDEGDSDASLERARELARDGDWGEAAAEARQVLEDDPGNGRAQSILGHSLYELGEYREARQYLERAARGSRPGEQVLLDLGNTLLELNDESGANEAFQRYLELYPEGDSAAELRSFLGD